ncbi:halo transducer protein [Halosimplex amylolyticum]|uniref:halo transducer protein n=1 Tax=Halosimplex amylolyticum TaxID=3396616 RepID=UPI003F556058
MTDTTHDADGTEAIGGTDETIEGSDATDGASLDGLALDEAVERVLAREGERDPGTVRTALEYVVEDGVVSGAAVEEALKATSKLVATAETRTELARIALDDAREAAEPVADLPTVAARLDRFEAEVTAVEERAAALGEAVQSVVEDREDPDARFAVADGIRQIEARSRAVQRDADDLQFDLEEFERWLDSHDARVSTLAEDVDALASSLDALAEAVDDLAAGIEGPGGGPADGDANGDADGSGAGVARAWFDATLRVGVIGLTVDDLRAELGDLRTWADREDEAASDTAPDGGLADLDARLADIEARGVALDDRLDDLATPDWRDRFGDRIDGFERDLDDLAPPVEWRAVERALETRRAEADSAE